MLFTWDDIKAATNEAKHDGVSFEEAVTVITNALSLVATDPRHPERDNVIGYSDHGRVLFVVSIEVSENEIRIISARKATRYERKRYEEGH